MEVEANLQGKIESILRNRNLRRTPQRDVIIRAAFGSTDHFTADELWEKAKTIDSSTSRATLYRTLALLVEADLLREIDLGRDQKCYDPNFLESPNHNHLICEDCDRVVEFEDHHLELLEDCITRRLGFFPASKGVRITAKCEAWATRQECPHHQDNAAGQASLVHAG